MLLFLHAFTVRWLKCGFQPRLSQAKATERRPLYWAAGLGSTQSSDQKTQMSPKSPKPSLCPLPLIGSSPHAVQISDHFTKPMPHVRRFPSILSLSRFFEIRKSVALRSTELPFSVRFLVRNSLERKARGFPFHKIPQT